MLRFFLTIFYAVLLGYGVIAVSAHPHADNIHYWVGMVCLSFYTARMLK